MSEGKKLTREEIAASIVTFAEGHNLKIHPGQDPLKWADLVIRNNGCPCVPSRHECPCEFVMEDVREIGRCRCALFCNDAYIREYNSLIAARKPRKRWTRKPKVSSSRKSV